MPAGDMRSAPLSRKHTTFNVSNCHDVMFCGYGKARSMQLERHPVDDGGHSATKEKQVIDGIPLEGRTRTDHDAWELG